MNPDTKWRMLMYSAEEWGLYPMLVVRGYFNRYTTAQSVTRLINRVVVDGYGDCPTAIY